MVVRYTEKGWEIITQRAHGLLAAQICARWKIADQPNRWVETLVACDGHDDVFNELEDLQLITDSGGPMNFDMNKFDENLSQRLVNMALTKSSFVALLIARHIEFTHGSEPKAKAFLKALKKDEQKWLKIAETSESEVARAYELLEFADAFSLLICQNQLQPEARSLEISNGPDGTKYQVICVGEKLQVTPWPFEVEEFPVSLEIRTITQLSFKSNKELARKIHDTMPVRTKFKIVRRV